jgi:phage FluMu protein Com
VTTAAAVELRCGWCGALILELVAAAYWRYRCGRCKGARSSTGYARPPTRSPHPSWAKRANSTTA